MTTHPLLEMETATVADVALAFPNAIDILNQYHLDFCCQGKVPFTEACRKANLNPDTIWSEIQQAGEGSGTGHPLRFENWSSSMLVDFIVQHHHQYVQEAIPRIQELLEKICSVHGDTNPELMLVRDDFNDLANELLNHLPKEEQILFPAIKRLEGSEAHDPGQVIMPSALKMPIHMMEDEHERAANLVKSIRRHTQQYTVPEYACPTYQLTFNLLNEFDNDLMQHIHLENNILFPRVKNEM
jgi:regulator of cell morphogenesis and NO signaling